MSERSEGRVSDESERNDSVASGDNEVEDEYANTRTGTSEP